MSALNLARVLSVLEEAESSSHSVALSSTMLSKSTIDASSEIRKLFKEKGIINFDEIERGQENKMYIPCKIVTSEQIVDSEASCYRPAAKPDKKGDPRFWPRKMSSYCRPGDILLILAPSNSRELYMIIISGDETFDDLVQKLILLELIYKYPEDNSELSLEETLPQHLVHLSNETDSKDTSPLSATEVTLADLLDGQQKFIMPRFQRTFNA